MHADRPEGVRATPVAIESGRRRNFGKHAGRRTGISAWSHSIDAAADDAVSP